MSARRLVAIVIACGALSACGGGRTLEGPAPDAPDIMTLTSPAFRAGQPIPARFTCSGEEVSPPLRWRGVPERARELVLVVEDPDAPGGTFVHWTVFGLPAATEAFAEGEIPRGGRIGENSSGNKRWRGPCPPERDEPHRYVFLIYALQDPTGLKAGATPEQVRDKLDEGAALARGRLEATFGR